MLTTENPFTVFISYARPDSRRAQEAYRLLLEASLGPWLDSENIPAGSEWAPYIERAIRDSSNVLVLLSRNSVTRDGFLQREILWALERWREKAPGQTYLIPARLDDCPKHERLAHLHWIDLIAATKSIAYMRLGAIKAENDGVDNLLFTINLDPIMIEHPHFETFLRWHRHELAHNVIFEINESTTMHSLKKLRNMQVEFDLRYAADDANNWNPQVRADLVDRVEMTKLDYNGFTKAMELRGNDPIETMYTFQQHKIGDKPLVLEGVERQHIRFLERYWKFEERGYLYGQGQNIECGPPWEEAVSPLKPYGFPGGGFLRKRPKSDEEEDDGEEER